MCAGNAIHVVWQSQYENHKRQIDRQTAGSTFSKAHSACHSILPALDGGSIYPSIIGATAHVFLIWEAEKVWLKAARK